MNTTLLVTIVIVIIGTAYWLASVLYPIHIYKKLNSFLEKEDYESFDVLYNKRGKFLSNFNNALVLLNKAFLQANEKAIVSTIKKFDEIKMNLDQQAIAYSKAFYFYLSVQEYEMCKHYYDLLKNNEHYEDYHNLDIVYDVYIEKGNKYLNELLKDENNLKNLSLISAIYSNLGDTKKVREYEDKIDKIVEKNSK